mmetsp:Transcript_5925/g.15741  ORF Transcript_5925/g.15741 Transcript_5925/m.15741 type:complete len:203 (-) Transcript_5925:137-745(-)
MRKRALQIVRLRFALRIFIATRLHYRNDRESRQQHASRSHAEHRDHDRGRNVVHRRVPFRHRHDRDQRAVLRILIAREGAPYFKERIELERGALRHVVDSGDVPQRCSSVAGLLRHAHLKLGAEVVVRAAASLLCAGRNHGAAGDLVERRVSPLLRDVHPAQHAQHEQDHRHDHERKHREPHACGVDHHLSSLRSLCCVQCL